MRLFTITLCSLLPLFCVQCGAQIADNTSRHNTKNIYYQTMSHVVEFEVANRAWRHCDSLFIESDPWLRTDSILGKTGNTDLVMLEREQLHKIGRKKKKVELFRLFPMQFENGEFSVSCVLYYVSYDRKKRTYLYEKSDGYVVFFSFDNYQFKFLRINTWGI